jgi:FkbM family methyltransferase
VRYLLGLLKSKAIYEYFPGRIRRMTSFYANIVGAGDLSFDVGSHLGNRAQVLAKLGCKVIAVEPHPFLASYLRNKFARTPNVTVEEVALSQTSGEATLFCSPGNLMISSLHGDWPETLQGKRSRSIEFSERHTVTTITIEQLVEKYGRPKYCKIDIEGVDVAVLKSLARPIAIISFEHLPNLPGKTAAAVEFLGRLAPYRFNFFVKETHVLHFANTVSGPELLETLATIAAPGKSCDIFAFASASR